MLPALDGLIGDDVSAVTISAIKNKYMPLVEQLVDDCDFVAQQLKTDIGNSDLKSLLRQASAIFDGVLADAGYARV